jgi:PTS system nitrogen regulatory IIA component
MAFPERTDRSNQFGGPTKVSKKTKSMGPEEEPILAGYMTTKEVAKYLKLHEVTVNKYAAKGKIPAIRIGSVWRFDKEGIDKWISEGQEKVTQKTKEVFTGDIDPNIIKKSKKGARDTTLKMKAEFKDDNQRPIIYKLRKQGKTKGERRGVYVEA